MNYEKINITDTLVIAGLLIVLTMAVFYRQTELSMSIASGLIGYIGGSARTANHQDKQNQGGR